MYTKIYVQARFLVPYTLPYIIFFCLVGVQCLQIYLRTANEVPTQVIYQTQLIFAICIVILGILFFVQGVSMDWGHFNRDCDIDFAVRGTFL